MVILKENGSTTTITTPDLDDFGQFLQVDGAYQATDNGQAIWIATHDDYVNFKTPNPDKQYPPFKIK